MVYFLMRLLWVDRSELFSSRLAESKSNIPATKKHEASSFFLGPDMDTNNVLAKGRKICRMNVEVHG